MSVSAETLASVKGSLRISAAIFDNELTELIEACKLDLKTAGMKNIDEGDKLTLQAVKLYCRANFENGSVQERELYQKRYEKLKDTLAVSGMYRPEVAEP